MKLNTLLKIQSIILAVLLLVIFFIASSDGGAYYRSFSSDIEILVENDILKVSEIGEPSRLMTYRDLNNILKRTIAFTIPEQFITDAPVNGGFISQLLSDIIHVEYAHESYWMELSQAQPLTLELFSSLYNRIFVEYLDRYNYRDINIQGRGVVKEGVSLLEYVEVVGDLVVIEVSEDNPLTLHNVFIHGRLIILNGDKEHIRFSGLSEVARDIIMNR